MADITNISAMSQFASLLSISVGLNFAYAYVKDEKRRLYTYIENHFYDTGLSLTKKMAKHLIYFNDKVNELDIKSNNNKKQAYNKLEAWSARYYDSFILKGKRLFERKFHSEASLLLGLYALFLLLLIPLSICNIDYVLFTINILVTLILIYVIILFDWCEKIKWSYNCTFFSIIGLIASFVILTNFVDEWGFTMSDKLKKANLLYTLLLPFFCFIYYYVVGSLWTNLKLLDFKIKSWVRTMIFRIILMLNSKYLETPNNKNEPRIE